MVISETYVYLQNVYVIYLSISLSLSLDFRKSIYFQSLKKNENFLHKYLT